MQVTDDIHEGRVGERSRGHIHADAPDRGDPHPGGKGRQLGEKPALADACFAADEDDARLTGGRAFERLGQRRSLGDAANEDRAGDAAGHSPMMRPAVLSGNASDGGVSDRRTGSSAGRVRGDPAVFALAVGDREVQAEWVHRGSPGSLSRDREVMKLETRQPAAIGRSLTSAA